MPLHSNRHPYRLRYDRSMLPDDETIFLVLPPSAAALRCDSSLLPYDDTVFEVPRLPPNVRPYGGGGGALSRDLTEYSDFNRRFPHYGHHHRLSDSPLLNPVSRRVVAGLSEEAIANYTESRVRRHQNGAVWDDEVPRLHSNGGALSRDHRHSLSDSTLIFDAESRRVELSEEAIANYMEKRVRRRENDAVSEEDGLCVICLDEENGRIVVRLDCGHDYHFNCINKWLNRSNTCPLCKAAVILPSSSHN